MVSDPHAKVEHFLPLQLARSKRSRMGYPVELTRDQIHDHLPLPKEIQNMVIGYAVTIGDLLMYIQVVFPDAVEDEPPYYFMPTAMNIGIWIDANDPTRMELMYNDYSFRTRLTGNNDPLDACMDKMRELFGGFGSREWMLHSCMPDIQRHIKFTMDACLKHLLRAQKKQDR
jgi:hypothetical protein